VSDKTVSAGSAVLFALLIGLGAAEGSAHAEMSMMLEFAPEASLGLGWNTLRNAPTDRRETCIENFADPVVSKNKQLESTGSFRLVHSTSDILDGFDLSASAAFHGIFYKGSGSISYATSQSISAEMTNAAGFVTVETDATSLRAKDAPAAATAYRYSFAVTPAAVASSIGGLRLKQEYLDLLKSGSVSDRKTFFEICGDGFISDIYRGGRLSTVLTISSRNREDRQKLQASLSGEGGGASVSVGTMIEKVSKSSVSSFSANFHAVSGCGQSGVTSLDAMKNLLETFAGCVRSDPAGIRMRVISYDALVTPPGKHRFGVPEGAAKAARAYLDLNSIWATMHQMRDTTSDLHDKLVWSRSVGTSCLGEKQDEILDVRKRLKESLSGCNEAIGTTIDRPAACEAEAMQANLAQPRPASAGCPTTSRILDGLSSQYDYLVFWPAMVRTGVQENSCHQQVDGFVADAVYQDWIKPVIDLRCSGPDVEDKADCRSGFPNAVKSRIPVHPRVTRTPTGGYQRTCKDCRISWNGSGGQVMKCQCKRGGKYGWTKSITLQCPQTAPLENCKRTLKYGKSC
jgi:hypothetical protein